MVHLEGSLKLEDAPLGLRRQHKGDLAQRHQLGRPLLRRPPLPLRSILSPLHNLQILVDCRLVTPQTCACSPGNVSEHFRSGCMFEG